MTPEQQNIIDNVHRISDWCIRGLILIALVVMFIKPDNWVWWVLGALLLIAILLNVVSAHWATDEEKEQRKQEIKDAVREYKEEESSKPKRTIFSPDEIKCPLIKLTPQQVAVVHDILQHITEQNGHLKTSDLVQILRALKGQGDLDDSDMQQVIAWVEYVTEKKVDVRNFKYDYNSKYSETGVIKWGNKIRAKFEKLEIS